MIANNSLRSCLKKEEKKLNQIGELKKMANLKKLIDPG